MAKKPETKVKRRSKKPEDQPEYDGTTELSKLEHELFCNECVHNTISRAYQIVYNPDHKGLPTSSDMVKACQLLRKPKIKKRYDVLVLETLEICSLSRTDRMNQLRRLMARAEEEGNHTAVKGYHELILKMTGEVVNKVDVTTNGETVTTNTNVIVDADAIKDAVDKFSSDF